MEIETLELKWKSDQVGVVSEMRVKQKERVLDF